MSLCWSSSLNAQKLKLGSLSLTKRPLRGGSVQKLGSLSLTKRQLRGGGSSGGDNFLMVGGHYSINQSRSFQPGKLKARASRITCSIHETQPVKLGQITCFKDRIATAAHMIAPGDGKPFLLFNGCIDGDVDESKYETCNDITMKDLAASEINRPIVMVHQYSFPVIDMDLEHLDQAWSNIFVSGRYVTRFFLGNEWEELFTEFNDDKRQHNYSTHMLHIRYEEKLNDRDIAYLSKIENPKSVEIRMETKVDELVEKCKLINPENAKGALVVIVHPRTDMDLRGYAGKFRDANVKATWVLSPLLISCTSDPNIFEIEEFSYCEERISMSHCLMNLGGAELGGLLLETRVKEMFIPDVAKWGPGWCPIDHPGGSLSVAKEFLQACGRSYKLNEQIR